MVLPYRYLGRSGLKITEITYGNWLTHGSQVENDTAKACVRAALDAGITLFDTADVYANTKAETVPRRGVEGRAAPVARDLHQGARRPAPAARTTPGCRASTSLSRSDGSLQPPADGLRRPVPGASLRRSRPRSKGDDAAAFADVVALGQGALHRGSRSGPRTRSGPVTALAKDLGFQLISNQPQYSALWRVIEGEVVPTSAEASGVPQIVWSPVAQGVLTGKYKPGQAPPAGSRATDEEGWRPVHRPLPRAARRAAARAGPHARRRRASPACRWPSWPWRGCCRTRTRPPRSSARPGPSRSRRTSRRPV